MGALVGDEGLSLTGAQALLGEEENEVSTGIGEEKQQGGNKVLGNHIYMCTTCPGGVVGAVGLLTIWPTQCRVVSALCDRH